MDIVVSETQSVPSQYFHPDAQFLNPIGNRGI